MAKPALGRGLGALLSGASTGARTPAAHPAPTTSAPAGGPGETAGAEAVRRVALQLVEPSALQPRKDFSEETLKELADSIRSQGILQPLIVRPRGERFELIAGERRWRAAQLAGLTDVPVIVRQADDHTVLQMMLIENLQRENLNAIEEALGYQQLMGQFQLRQEDIATKVGKNRATVANALRLLGLPPEVQQWVRHGQLAPGHAKVILGLDRPEEQRLAAENVIRDGLSVRATEELVAHWQAKGVAGPRRPAAGATASATRDAHVAELENQIRQKVGTKVQLRYRQGKGSVTIHFFSDDDLDRLLDVFSIKVG